MPVFALIGAMGIVLHVLEGEHLEDVGTAEVGGVLLLVVVAALIRSVGSVVYAGFLEQAVGADIDDQPLPSITDALRTLPIWRLIGADVVVTLIVAAATVLAVVPGLIAFALLGIVGPVINIEDRGVFDAIRRSVELTRGRFWTAFALLVPLLVVEHAAETWFVLAVDGTPVLAAIGFGVLIGLTVGATLGLIEVVLAHRLIRADRER